MATQYVVWISICSMVTIFLLVSGMIVKGLYDLRAQLLLSGEPADDIEALMLRIMDAQGNAERRRSDREAR